MTTESRISLQKMQNTLKYDAGLINDHTRCKLERLINEIIEAEVQPVTVNTKEVEKSDSVNHPSHYTWLKDLCGIEVIDITRYMDFNLGNAIKYILRNGHKSEEGMSDKEKAIEDLRKAAWYINDKIEMLSNEL